MLSDWLGDDGRKATWVMGLPRYDRGRLVLCHSEETEDKDEHWFLMGGAEGPTDLPPSITVALLRDRAREWLDEHRTFVHPASFNYDTALIAAILVTKEAGHDA